MGIFRFTLYLLVVSFYSWSIKMVRDALRTSHYSMSSWLKIPLAFFETFYIHPQNTDQLPDMTCLRLASSIGCNQIALD